MHSMRPDQYFTDVIAKPIVRKSTSNRDVEVSAEDEQQFLLRQQQYLQQGVTAPTPANAGSSLPPSIQKTPDRKSVGSPGVQGSPRKVLLVVNFCRFYLTFLFQCLVEAWRKLERNSHFFLFASLFA